MVTVQDVESYLIRMELEYEEVGEGMWRVTGSGLGGGLVLYVDPPVLVFRLKVMDIPSDEKKCAELYRRLLEYNASDLMHAAYGLEQGDVVLVEALQLENLDFNEFEAVVDSFQMALASQLETLSPYRDC